ncbi:MAG: hypothetical protein ACPGVU_01960 [Limisphaerales bacterium]
MKTIIAVLFIGISLTTATTPKAAWTFHAGSSKHDKIRALTVDHNGNTIITGEFSATAKFGDIELTANGALDLLIAKLDSKGRLLWARSFGGEKIDRGYAVATDAAGNSYITGHFQSETLAFDTTVLTNRGDYDIFVVKLDSSGNPIWAQSAGGPAYDFGHGIGVDPKGGIWVSGMIRREGDFGSIAAQSGMGPFVVRYTNAGAVEWTWQMQGKGSGSAHELCVDQNGNAYVGGFFAGGGKLGTHSVKTSKGRDLFAAKLSRSGEFQWVFQAGGASDGLVSGIAADRHGNCFIGGMFKATARLGNRTFTSAGDHDFYLAKLNAKGRAQWAAHAGGPSIDYGLGLAVDARGNALLTGETTGDVDVAGKRFRQIGKRDLYAAKFSPEGKLIWAWQAGGTLNSLSYTAGCGPDGLNVIGGAFSGKIEIDGGTFGSHGSNDIIVIALRD